MYSLGHIFPRSELDVDFLVLPRRVCCTGTWPAPAAVSVPTGRDWDLSTAAQSGVHAATPLHGLRGGPRTMGHQPVARDWILCVLTPLLQVSAGPHEPSVCVACSR